MQLVSVVIPVFNYGQYLGEAIEKIDGESGTGSGSGIVNRGRGRR